MNPSQGDGDGRVLSRRSMLGRLGGTAGVLAGTAGCIGDGSGGQATTGGDGTVTFGLTTSESGPYNAEGSEEQRGFELAVEHLNDGGGLVESGAMSQLSGKGVLGRDVETVVHDTGGSAQQAADVSKAFARDDDVVMYTGGIAGEVVLELTSAADENAVPYMAGPTPINAVTGADCSRYVFRELFSSTTLVRALGPALFADIGKDATYYHLTVDSPTGSDLEETIDTYFSNDGNWRLNGSSSTIPGSTNFEKQLQTAEGSVPDVLFLNLFGLDAANALDQAADVVSDDIQVVVPYLNRTVAQTARENIATAVGAVPWIWGLDDGPSSAFEDAYRNAYESDASTLGEGAPSGLAHHAYVQTLQYAAAAERAGSFDADSIRTAMNGYSYDVGLGNETMRACDHQAVRPVPLVRGRRASQQKNGQYLNLREIVGDVTPACGASPNGDCSF